MWKVCYKYYIFLKEMKIFIEKYKCKKYVINIKRYF